MFNNFLEVKKLPEKRRRTREPGRDMEPTGGIKLISNSQSVGKKIVEFRTSVGVEELTVGTGTQT